MENFAKFVNNGPYIKRIKELAAEFLRARFKDLNI